MTRAYALTAVIAIVSIWGCSRAPDHAVENASPAADSAAPAAGASPAPSITPAAIETAPSIRISDKNGTVTIGGGAADPTKLGVPLYPGATRSTSGGNFSESDANGSTAITTLDANAAFDVIDLWYKAHVPSDAQQSRIGVSGETTVSYAWTSRDRRTDRVVTINSNHGSPIITISLKISISP